jgi:hypothetical protein
MRIWCSSNALYFFEGCLSYYHKCNTTNFFILNIPTVVKIFENSLPITIRNAVQFSQFQKAQNSIKPAPRRPNVKTANIENAYLQNGQYQIAQFFYSACRRPLQAAPAGGFKNRIFKNWAFWHWAFWRYVLWMLAVLVSGVLVMAKLGFWIS